MVTSRASTGRALFDRQPISPDRLFAELDHYPITGDPAGSTIEVISIHVTPDAGAWVQMEVAGEPKQSVLLHLPQSTTVDQAIAALNAWGQIARERRPQCIDVAPARKVEQILPQPIGTPIFRTEWRLDPRRI
jgi:hypothetical protein